jgi:hypothetical protein
MAIRKLHSNNATENRADIATQYTELFFDDTTNSILLPDPTGLLETKIGSTSSNGLKGFASGYVNAGTFVTLDNLKFSVTTGGQRGLCCATVSGTVALSISANYALVGGASGSATQYPGATYTTTPSGSWFGWSFPNAGDGSTYLINDYANQRFYRVTLSIGVAYNNNFISIERLH